jgi:hypothetical protein
MQELNFRKETFDLSDSSRYELSIQAGLDGFLFMIKEKGEIVRLSHCPFSYPNEKLLLRKIREIYDEQGLTDKPFLKTEIYFSDPEFSLIPQPLFSGKLASGILSGDTKPVTGTVILTTTLETLNATLSFPVSISLYNFLLELHPGCTIGHEVALLLRNFARTETPSLFIHLHETWFYAISFNDKGLKFLNTYRYQTPGDFLYYLLSAGTLPEVQGLPVRFSGNINGENACFNLARQYFGQAEISRYLPGPGLHPESREIPAYCLPGITLL